MQMIALGKTLVRKGHRYAFAVLLGIAAVCWLVVEADEDKNWRARLRILSGVMVAGGAAGAAIIAWRTAARNAERRAAEAQYWAVSAYPRDVVADLLEAHGLGRNGLDPLCAFSTENDIWATDDVVVRIAKSAGAASAMRSEPSAVQTAKKANVLSPALLHHGSLTEKDVPYTIFERKGGQPLGVLDANDPRLDALLREVGSEIAKLHTRACCRKGDLRVIDFEIAPYCLRLCKDAGVIAAPEAQRIADWLEHLAMSLHSGRTRCPVHNDLHPWNILVDQDSWTLSGIVDWSNAGWADPANDFSGFPLRMIPSLVQGAKDAGDLTGKNVEGRILWQWASLALWEMAKLDLSEYDRRWWRWPEGGVDEVAELLQNHPDQIWRRWAPA